VASFFFLSFDTGQAAEAA